jgi:pimeloyl-ACP methyl ester carboxylesterase
MKSAIVAEPFSFHNDGIELAGAIWNPPTRRGTIVLLHGGGQTRHSWAASAESFAIAGWRVIAYDARGHGDSGWSASGDYGVDAGVADLRALVEGLDEVPVLVGASMGGISSLLAAGNDPALTQALVLVDIVIRLEPEGTKRIHDFMSSAPAGFATLEEVADAVAAYAPDRPRPRNIDGLRKNVRLRADGRWYWHWDPEILRIGEEPRRDATEAMALAAAVGLTAPTLIVRGLRSDIVSEEGLTETLQLIPHAEYVQVDAGHMVVGDDNAVFTQAVCEFLDRTLAG